ncbi:hypothetical protein [Jatrophihabitans sp.]|uniref:hypothetical protein n=1 Tax=Jatrophihabitans sp. TaxID=1932789 RepID=UPI0030C7170E
MQLVQRKAAAVVTAGNLSAALGLSSVLAGHSADGTGFLLFVLSLPWTLAVYSLSALLGLTSAAAVTITLAAVTLLAWRIGSSWLIRHCASPSAVSPLGR